jgi:hypothetical protein
MTKKKTAMFYTGELHKAKPIAIVIASMLIFWAFTVYNFPDWAFIIFAVVSGVSIALALGEVIDRRLRRQLGDRELAETTRRHKLQEELDDASRRS